MERDQVKSIVITLPIQHKATLASIILNQGNKENSQQTTGEVYSTYAKLCSSYNLDELSQRRVGHIISELDMQGLINAKIVNLGRHGRTKYIDLAVDKEQLLRIIQHDHFLSDLIEAMTKLQIFTKSMQSRLI
jgi:cell division control protein 6